MRKLSLLFLVPTAAAVLLSGCSSKESIKQTLNENPDILFDVLQKNPQKFASVLESASREARQVAAEKAKKEEEARRAEEWKNPKKPLIAEDRAVQGKKDAPITIVAYSDFQCPYCKRGFDVVEEVRAKYGDKVRYMIKQFPLEFHPLAMPAAKYFESIAMQSSDKAYKFHDEVFRNQEKLGTEKEKYLASVAKKVGANMAKLKKDLESKTVADRIEADKTEAKSFGIQGTPGFIVEGVTLPGAYPFLSFQEIIDKKLAERGVATTTPN